MRDIRKSEESDLADSLVLWHCDSQQGVKRGVVEIGRKTVFHDYHEFWEALAVAIE